MLTFKIKIANKVLEINAFNESTKKYCRDFYSDEEPNYVITMTQEELDNESSNSPDGKVYGTEEISALYRKIADLLVHHHKKVAFILSGYSRLLDQTISYGVIHKRCCGELRHVLDRTWILLPGVLGQVRLNIYIQY